MDLILWRHAEAHDGSPDLMRALTDRGRRQAQKMAHWLKPRLPEACRILVSPATRARQTADALGLDYEVVEAIAPGAAPQALLAAAGWPDAAQAALLVGHQPALGQVWGLLMCGEARELSVKKGGIVWLTNRLREGELQTVVKAVMTPTLL
ncbi:MAG: histidine phosphatase family protein [Thiobacillaceae bacterium]|nr:histidine phosphatase family protein [Thiobacillaceae bacterium]